MSSLRFALYSIRKQAKMSQKSCTLICTQTFGMADPFILKCIDAGIWHAQQMDASEVDIWLIRTRNRHNLVGLIFRLASWPRRIRCKPPASCDTTSQPDGGIWSSLSSRRQNRPSRSQDYCPDRESLGGPSKEVATFSSNGLTIRVQLYLAPLFDGIGEWARVHARGFALFCRCFASGRLNSLNLILITFSGIRIGDLVASSALRLRAYGGGSTSRSKLALLDQFIDAVAFVEYSRKKLMPLIEQKKSSSAFMARETTYLDAIYARHLSEEGVRIVSTYSSSHVYRYYPMHEVPYENERLVRRDDSYALTPYDLKYVNEHLASRIDDPSRALRYMRQNSNKLLSLCDAEGHILTLQGDKASAVLFLHSFDDAQYVYGFDGFDDLWEWTIFTIDTLIENRHVEAVIIKPHPNVDYRCYPGDRKANQLLKARYRAVAKVFWVSPECSPRVFRDNGHFVGITHHGSIAEELVYLGIPVIASTHAPWSDKFQFVLSWNGLDDYLALLRADLSGLRVTPKQTKELESYVFFSRTMNPVDFMDRWPWYHFLEECGIKASGDFYEVYDIARHELDKVRGHSALSRFIESRTAFHRSRPNTREAG